MIEVQGLQFSYPQSDFQLRMPRLEVEHGSTVALIGPSGTGKTTVLSLLAGILVPDTGAVRVNGTPISGLEDRDRRDFRIRTAGLVFQEFELLEYLSVLDNILLPYRISGALALTENVHRRATLLAGQVGIGDKLRRYPGQLSQGERQRAALCRALLPQPPVILADEPTGNLDPANRDRVLELVFDYVRTHEATLIAVTHEHDLLDRFQRVEDVLELQQEGKP
jgi:ABC-type lipoprotein export system ATPase subunit